MVGEQSFVETLHVYKLREYAIVHTLLSVINIYY